MGINIRAKGQTGEREIADMLNFIIYTTMGELGFTEEECLKGFKTVQRNQLQSAIGGNDLTNCYGLSIEIKRQEQLAVGTWWKQCVASAQREKEIPVLMYRQNRKPWKVRTYVWLALHDGSALQVEAEFDIETFKTWFAQQVRIKLIQGEVK